MRDVVCFGSRFWNSSRALSPYKIMIEIIESTTKTRGNSTVPQGNVSRTSRQGYVKCYNVNNTTDTSSSLPFNSHGARGVMEGDRKRSPDDSINNEPTSKRKRPAEPEEAWTPDLHRAFVEAIFSMGMNNASPSVIIQNMTSQSDELTAERIKSHLQKYRKRRDKSTAEFMTEYDTVLRQCLLAATSKPMGGPDSLLGARLVTPPKSDPTTLRGGELAAHLTLATLVESAHFAPTDVHSFLFPPGVTSSEQQSLLNPSGSFKGHMMMKPADFLTNGISIPFPQLSETEAQSPIGIALHHTVCAIQAMNQQLEESKRAATSRPEGVGGRVTSSESLHDSDCADGTKTVNKSAVAQRLRTSNEAVGERNNSQTSKFQDVQTPLLKYDPKVDPSIVWITGSQVSEQNEKSFPQSNRGPPSQQDDDSKNSPHLSSGSDNDSTDCHIEQLLAEEAAEEGS